MRRRSGFQIAGTRVLWSTSGTSGVYGWEGWECGGFGIGARGSRMTWSHRRACTYVPCARTYTRMRSLLPNIAHPPLFTHTRTHTHTHEHTHTHTLSHTHTHTHTHIHAHTHTPRHGAPRAPTYRNQTTKATPHARVPRMCARPASPLACGVCLRVARRPGLSSGGVARSVWEMDTGVGVSGALALGDFAPPGRTIVVCGAA